MRAAVRRRVLLPLLACGFAVMLQACAQTDMTNSAPTRSEAPASEPSKRCDAQAAQFAVGKEPTRELVETARRQAGADRVRVIRHDQMVTKEYLMGRLNLLLDERGMVRQVECG